MNKKIAVLNVKNLAVFVVMAALAMFMAVGMASADNNANVTGEYAFSGRVSYILTPSGFNPSFVPNVASTVTSNSINCQGIFTFKRDGTGRFDSTGVLLALPPQPSPQVPHANAFTWSFTFTYDVADDDTITLDADENTFTVTFDTGTTGPNGMLSLFTADKYPLSGMVSADHKTMTLGSPTTFIQTLTFFYSPGQPSGIVLQGIPNSSYVLTRLRQGEGGK